jgi:hypothetical protein
VVQGGLHGLEDGAEFAGRGVDAAELYAAVAIEDEIEYSIGVGALLISLSAHPAFESGQVQVVEMGGHGEVAM